MGAAEFSRSDLVAVPLVDELAVLVEVQDAGGADHVVGRQADIVGAFIAMALGDEDVAMGRKSDIQRLPQQSLLFAFVPVATLAA